MREERLAGHGKVVLALPAGDPQPGSVRAVRGVGLVVFEEQGVDGLVEHVKRAGLSGLSFVKCWDETGFAFDLDWHARSDDPSVYA